MTALRAVLDTNVLLDLWVFGDPAVRPLHAAIDAGRLLPLSSGNCDAEFADVLGRGRFALDEAARRGVMARWVACRQPIAVVTGAPMICADADDQKFLDAAFSATADVLLTRDRALLALATRAATAGLRIARPAAFRLP